MYILSITTSYLPHPIYHILSTTSYLPHPIYHILTPIHRHQLVLMAKINVRRLLKHRGRDEKQAVWISRTVNNILTYFCAVSLPAGRQELLNLHEEVLIPFVEMHMHPRFIEESGMEVKAFGTLQLLFQVCLLNHTQEMLDRFTDFAKFVLDPLTVEQVKAMPIEYRSQLERITTFLSVSLNSIYFTLLHIFPFYILIG